MIKSRDSLLYFFNDFCTLLQKAKQVKVKVQEEVVEKVEIPEAVEPENKIDKEDHSRFMPS